MTIYRLGDTAPDLAATAWVAKEATVIGRVRLAERVSVWPGAVVRGDNEPIVIGDGSNLQEGAVLHADPGFPLTIGAHVTVGHQAMLHGCTIGDGTLVGIQAVVLNGAVVGRDCLIGAGAIVTQGKVFPDRTLILGAPAKAVRELTEDELGRLRTSASEYAVRGAHYRQNLVEIG